MKNNKVLNIIFYGLFLLQILAEGAALVIVWQLNMVPSRYLLLLGLGLFLLTGISALLLLPRGKKPVLSIIRRAIGCVLAVAILCGCVAASVVVADFSNAMDDISSPVDGDVTRAVYVRKDDPAQTLADAADYTFGIVQNYDEKNTNQAIAVLESKFGKQLSVTSFETVPAMVDALYAGDVNAILLNSGYVPILEDTEGYEDFSAKTRVLEQISIVQETEPTQPPTETQAPTEPETVTNTPFVMYLGGSDTRSSWLSTSRNDVNILVVVNPETKQVLLINTPRDYYVPNPAGDGALDKLTHCGIYGVDCSAQAVADLYGVPVDYYAQINFTGFETLVDAVGGVTVYSDVSYTAVDTWIQAGENHLNGKEALNFSRERYNLSGGDNARGKNQMKVIKAIIEKMTTGTTVISNYSDIMDSLSGMFKTDMTTDEISMLVKMQLTDMARWNINTYAVTGSGGSNVTYSAPGQYLYVMYPNEDAVAHASALIERVMAGQILTDADMAG